MSWNYRVVKTKVNNEDSYGIHEVYYDEYGVPRMYTENPCSVCSEVYDDLEEELKRFAKAFELPVLTESDFQKSRD